MKKRLLISGLLTFLLITGRIEAQPLHRLSFDSPARLRTFFQWTADAAPIVSGHRGGMVSGFPENSIETFENTLRHTPAIFEIDPRLTKDSVIVLMHDATLDRTTTGSGKLSDYTWEQLKALRLKDADGRVTPYRIPTLAETIEWARGKTVLNLDRKDVPFARIADLIRKHRADAFVMLTVHTPEQARYYYQDNPERMFSAFIQSRETMEAYEKAGIPWANLIAYIGPEVKPSNQEMYRLLHTKKVRCMISAAPTYDKLKSKAERAAAYRAIIHDGARILESDLPIEVAEALGPVARKEN